MYDGVTLKQTEQCGYETKGESQDFQLDHRFTQTRKVFCSIVISHQWLNAHTDSHLDHGDNGSGFPGGSHCCHGHRAVGHQQIVGHGSGNAGQNVIGSIWQSNGNDLAELSGSG